MSKSTAIVKVTESRPQKIVLMPEFNAARKRIESIKEHGRRMQHEMILLGIELNRVKDQLGIRAGRPSKLPHGAEIKPWETLVVEQTGYSLDTCDRWMKIAKGAQNSIPLLTSPDVLKKPFNKLSEAKQGEIVKTLHKAVDGQTMQQMMIHFGVVKPPQHKSPPKATKQSAANRNDNAANETLTAEQLMEQAREDINTLHDIHIGEAWRTLDDADLSDLENKLTAYLADVSAEHKKRKGSK